MTSQTTRKADPSVEHPFNGANVQPGLSPRPEATVHAARVESFSQQPAATSTAASATSPQRIATSKPKVQRPTPTMGWRLHLSRLCKWLGWDEYAPGPSAKERTLIEASEAKRKADIDRWRTLSWLSSFVNSARVHSGEVDPATGKPIQIVWTAQPLVIAILTQKGGAAKTELTVQLSRVFAKMIKPAAAPILIIPATRNPGNTTRNAGVTGEDTLTLPELETLLKRLEAENDQGFISATSVTERLRKNDDGVYVIAQTQLPPDFDADRYGWVLERLKKIFPIIIQDTGNNTAKEGEIEYMAAHMADVLVFSCYTGMPSSAELMGLTMDSYGILPDTAKLSASITVVNGLLPEDRLDDWARYAEFEINEGGDHVGLRRFPYRVTVQNGAKPTGSLLSIPWDDTLSRKDEVPIRQATADAYLALAVTIARTAGELRGLDLSTLGRIREIRAMIADFDPSLLSEQYPTPQAWYAAHPRGEAVPSTHKE